MRRSLIAAWAVGMVVVWAIILVNIMTRQHDLPGESLAETVVLEGSSGVMLAFALWIPGVLAVWARRRRPPLGRILAANVAACLVFFALHVGGFVVIRKVAYAAIAGATYRFGSIPREGL